MRSCWRFPERSTCSNSAAYRSPTGTAGSPASSPSTMSPKRWERRNSSAGWTRFASVGDLSAVIAHEIRNPLTGIRTTIQYVSGKLESSSVLRSDLADAIKELDRIEQFTPQISSIRATQVVSEERTGYQRHPGDVLDNLELQFAEFQIMLEKDLAPNIPRIPLDPDAIQQVILNIALNAIDSMQGGGQFKVSSSVRRYRSRLAVEVAFSDAGVGQVFPSRPSTRSWIPSSRPSRPEPVWDLSISLQILQEHGGRITVAQRQAGGLSGSLPGARGKGTIG